MRNITLLACASMMSLLSACSTPSDGYYDKNGNWIAYNRYSESHNHPPLPGGTHPPYDEDRPVHTTVTTVTYDRAGYYDYNGYYVSDNSFRVPRDMFPPRGMCRVWFPERSADNQPSIESCDGIRSRVPEGAYVIYGG